MRYKARRYIEDVEPAVYKWAIYYQYHYPYNELDELVSIGWVITYQAIEKYDKSQGTSRFTWIYENLKWHVGNYAKRNHIIMENDTRYEDLIPNKMGNPERIVIFLDSLKNLNEAAQSALEILLNESPYDLLGLDCFSSPRDIRGRLIRLLRERGYSWPKILAGIRELKSVASAIGG